MDRNPKINSLPMKRLKLFLPLIAFGVTVALVVVYMTSDTKVKVKVKEMWKVKENVLNADNRTLKTYNQDQKLQLLRENSVTSDLTHLDIELLSDLQVLMTLHSVLDNTETLCGRKLSIGDLDPGWEVCDDVKVRPRGQGCVVYSFGQDLSFVEDMAEIYQCEGFVFDQDLPTQVMASSSRVHLYNHGISDIDRDDSSRLSLKTIRSRLHHQPSDIDLIKLDLKPHDWSVLAQILGSDQLAHIRQLLVKFDVQPLPASKEISEAELSRRRLRILRDLHTAGFRAFYTRKDRRCGLDFREFPVKPSSCYDVHYINTGL